MKYQNKAGQPRQKCMIAAHALVTKYGATQSAIADVMDCSQGTIANWVKEVNFRQTINNLENENRAAQEYINDLAGELNLIEYNPEDYADEESDKSS
ncbi:MAG: hypothetical protein QX189_09110 [Methylococcales bacterium]